MYQLEPARFGQLPPVGPTAAPRTQTVRVVVKSYIAPIGMRIGATRCAMTNPASVALLAALARATDAAMSENPVTDAKDRRYRLFSAQTFTVTWLPGRILTVTPSGLDTDSGPECVPLSVIQRACRSPLPLLIGVPAQLACRIPPPPLCLQPPPLVPSGISLRRTGPATFEFSWTVRGRPHAAAEPGFQAVCPRTSLFIWHTVTGRIDCSGPTPRVTTNLTGSQFPSHRVFVDGTMQLPQEKPQGVFARLWIPSLSDMTKVA